MHSAHAGDTVIPPSRCSSPHVSAALQVLILCREDPPPPPCLGFRCHFPELSVLGLFFFSLELGSCRSSIQRVILYGAAEQWAVTEKECTAPAPIFGTTRMPFWSFEVSVLLVMHCLFFGVGTVQEILRAAAPLLHDERRDGGSCPAGAVRRGALQGIT